MTDTEGLENLLQQGYRYALALSHNEEDAYDLVQTAYLKVLESQRPLVLSYLLRIIRNSFIDSKRREKTKLKWRRRGGQQTADFQPAGIEPVLARLLSNLKSRDREILFLAVVEGFTAKEIGQMLEMPRNTILTILSRTKKTLRDQLEEKSISDGRIG